jgi:hypothetical protein
MSFLYTVDFTRDPGEDKCFTFEDGSVMPITDEQFTTLLNCPHLVPVLKFDDGSIFCRDFTPSDDGNTYGPYQVTVSGKVQRVRQ